MGEGHDFGGLKRPCVVVLSCCLLAGTGVVAIAATACSPSDAGEQPVSAAGVTPQEVLDDTSSAEHHARIQGMADNPVFIEAMTLQLARELDFDGVESHLLECLIEGEGAPRVREAVQLMPATVEGLIASGEWAPQDLKEWKWVVFTALREGLHDSLPISIERSMHLENSPTRYMAAGILFTPEEPLEDVLAEGFAHADANYRAYAACAVSVNGDARYVAELRELMGDDHPWVRANALASLIRLGDAHGISVALELLRKTGAERSALDITFLLEALERAALDGGVLEFVRGLQTGLVGVERAAVEHAGIRAILVLHGGDRDTSQLRRELLGVDPAAPELQRGVRALGKVLGEGDLQVLTELFRRPNSQTVAMELAVALAKAGSLEVEPLLRAAALELPWNQGLLAAGSARATYGDAMLVRWAREAPAGTPLERIRRLGWAVGVFGGDEAVHVLVSGSEEELGLLSPERRALFVHGARTGALQAGPR